jgi:hypothetical protein
MPMPAAKLVPVLTAATILNLVASDVCLGQTGPEVLLKVNGEVFTKTDLANREIWDTLQGNSLTFPQTIVKVISVMVVVQHGKTLGFAMSDQMFHDLIAAQMKANHLETEDQWRTAFTAEGLGPLADYRHEKELEMIAQQVELREVLEKVPVTDAEAREFYDKRIAGRPNAPTFEQVRAEIQARAVTDKRQQAWNSYVGMLRSQATIEWPIPTVKRAYDAVLAQTGTGATDAK